MIKPLVKRRKLFTHFKNNDLVTLILFKDNKFINRQSFEARVHYSTKSTEYLILLDFLKLSFNIYFLILNYSSSVYVNSFFFRGEPFSFLGL